MSLKTDFWFIFTSILKMEKLNASVSEVADVITRQRLEIKILRAKMSEMYTLAQVTKIYGINKRRNKNNRLIKPTYAAYRYIFSEILKNGL